MHGIIYILFLLALFILIVTNFIFLILFRSKFNIILKKIILFNCVLLASCVLLSILLYNVLMKLHKGASCEEFDQIEASLFLLLLLIPIGDFWFIQKHKKTICKINNDYNLSK